jgi:hypothetical protein
MADWTFFGHFFSHHGTAQFKLYVVLATMVLGVSCSKYDDELRIQEVAKTQLITIRKHLNTGFVYSISIQGSGTLVGMAKISLMEGDILRNKEDLSGDISFHWGGDWYSDTAEIVYEPSGVPSGELVLKYIFGTH